MLSDIFLYFRIRKTIIRVITLPSSEETGDPIFATIKHMVFIDVGDAAPKIHFLLEVWYTLLFDRHFHAYQVKKTETIVICQPEGFLDHHPLEVNCI